MPGEETKFKAAAIVKVHAAELAKIARYLRDDPSKMVALLAADAIDEIGETLCENFMDATGVALPLISK